MKNHISIIGYLGGDPKLKEVNGDQVVEFSVGTTEKYTTKAGEKKEETEWHDVVVWGKLAANHAKFLSKGSLVDVEGKLKTRSWPDKEDPKKKHYRTDLIATHGRVIYLGAPKGQGEPPPSGGF